MFSHVEVTGVTKNKGDLNGHFKKIFAAPWRYKIANEHILVKKERTVFEIKPTTQISLGSVQNAAALDSLTKPTP